MKQKQPVYKNLKSIPVYFEDTSLTSDEVFRITEFPLRLTSGKNIFKLQGNANNLNNGSYLNIEILDNNGDPIYNEITDVVTEDDSRVISIFIYSNTPPGDAEVILVASANFLFDEPVPEEWLDVPNVRWTRTIPVNPTQKNVSEIIFSQLPIVTVKEQVGVQLDRIYSTTQYPVYNTGKVEYISNNSYPILIISGGLFNNQMVGGTVTVNAPVNPTPESYYDIPTIPFSSTIKKVLSTSSILLDNEYKIAASESIFLHIYDSFDLSTYSIEYEATPTYSPTQNSESYALLEIDNLEPVSGDVSRIKVFMNNTGTVGTWELINDIELEETDIFVTNTASVEPYISIGNITSQTIINTYYTASSYLGKTKQTAPTLVYDNTDLSNALKIISNVDLSDGTRVNVLQISSSVDGKFIKDSIYKITFDAIGSKTDATGNTNPNILIYVSGSAFNFDYSDYYNQELPVQLGKRIGNLYVDTDSQRFDDATFYFTANETGTGVILFVIDGGEWKLSDIRTTTDNDIGYTPEYTRIRSLIPTPHKSNVQVAFKVEYYNSDGAKSKQVNYTDNLSFEGGNRYVDGEYSMLTGSLYVADSLESGIAISGYENTGYIRSLGYDGFNAQRPGFLLWSGSAMPGSTTAYSGVGLELYGDRDNYFRYRTNPSELVVKTKSFYFGSSSQYISGSNGKLAISSSNFYLDANGNVTLSGVVNITSGTGFATQGYVTSSVNTATGSLSASLNTTITANSSSAASSLSAVSQSLSSSIGITSSSLASRIVTDSANKIIKPLPTPSGFGAGLFLSQTHMGYYNNTDWNSYISSSGEFLFKKDANNLISFGSSSFILKISDTATISGSNINLITPNFFFGNDTQFISGSGGNLQIKSNNFSVSANGSVTASNMHLDNVAYADGFVYNTITINDSNYTKYFKNYTISGLYITGSATATTEWFTKIVLDGSLGGDSGKQVRLERLPDWPIGMIIPPGYQSGSLMGYDITIENWATNPTFTAMPFASLVASSSTGTRGASDFGFHADMWDRTSTAFRATGINTDNVRAASGSVKYYGEGNTSIYSTYSDITGQALPLHSRLLLLYYGNSYTFQRTVSSAPAFGLQSNYFQLTSADCNINLYDYFTRGFKTGGNVLMGGVQNSNISSRFADIHYDVTASQTAVLELRADTYSGTLNPNTSGYATVLIPPRFDNTYYSSSYVTGTAVAVEGAMYYNTTEKKLKVYDGTTWRSCW